MPFIYIFINFCFFNNLNAYIYKFLILKMEYRGIFPNSLELPNPFYVIGSFLLSIGLYYATSKFVMQKLTEKLYFLSAHLDIINRTQIYYFLINLPITIIGIVSLMYHRSLIGVEISLNMDQIQLLLISGYICWTQQSRQTPIRGFLFFRDIAYMIGALAIFGNFYYLGKIQLMYGFIFLGYFVVFYILHHLSNKIEESILLAFGIKQPDQFNCQFLLTQKNTEGNILAIRESISQNQENIKAQTVQFQEMVEGLVQNSKQKRIIKNFGRIFLRIKAGMQLEQQQNNEQKYEEYDERETIHNISMKSYFDVDKIEQQQEQKRSKRYQGHNYSSEKLQQNSINLNGSNFGLEHNDSSHDIIVNLNKANKSDYINQQIRNAKFEDQQFIEKQSLFEKLIKYLFYPVFMLSKPQGRLRYLCDYIGFFIVVGCMFIIANSGYYFSFLNSNNLALTSLIISFFLAYPPMKYFTQISAQNDFDFMNMFLQAGVLKLVIFGVTVTISSFIQQQKFVEFGLQNLLLLGIRSVTYIVLAIFMASKRFATRYTNFRFFIFLFGLQHCSRVVLQIIYKSVMSTPINQ